MTVWKLMLGGLCAVLALAHAAAAQVMVRPATPAAVRVGGGLVQGQTLRSGVKAWYGIPFAEPPVGDLRWRAPRPPRPWSGVRYALDFAPACVQEMRGPGQNAYSGPEAISEDCLYLNVWAPPAARSGSRLPVIVWVYGGGYVNGSASAPVFNGEALAKKGVVFVAIAYRVGALGFMAHPELSRESPTASSGAYGFLDQIAALKWVQANVARFGGDPGRVTVAGQSAGSMSISILQASPLAKGLFQRAVGMSGSQLTDDILIGLPEAEAVGLNIQKALNARSLADLRALPADRIIQLRMRTPPVIDGQVLPRAASAIFASGQANDVALMIGMTRDESFSPLAGVKSAADYEAFVRRTWPAEAEALLQRYPAGEGWLRSRTDLARDTTLGVMVRRWAQGQAGAGRKPVYAFLFSRVHPYAPGVRFLDHDPSTVGAYHGGDVAYWLGNLDAFNAWRPTRQWTGLDRERSQQMSDMLVAFARTGDPSIPGRRPPRYDREAEPMLEIGDQVRETRFPDHADAALIDGLKSARAPSTAPAAPRF